MTDAATITARAKSNLAFALRILPPERRAAMVTFYAYCRVIDDLADDTSVALHERQAGLECWRRGLIDGFAEPNSLQKEVVALRDQWKVPNEYLIAIIDGCILDLSPQRFGTWEDLSQYTWKVASAVGLASLPIFGANDPASQKFAVALGHALQLTNIIRDVGEDLANGVRIYLPLADLARFQYTERDLIGKVHDGRFLALMNYEADRAEAFYQEAAATLPACDRAALRPALIMGEIYQTLLAKMRASGFKVFQQRYRLSKARKLAILSKHLLLR